MVWETHKVREETNHSRFTFLPLLRLPLLTSKRHQDMHHLLMHPTRHAAPSQCQCSPSLDNRAGAWWFDSVCITSTFLACKSELEVDCPCILMLPPLPPPLCATASRRWFLYGVEMLFAPPPRSSLLMPPPSPLVDRSCSLMPFVHLPPASSLILMHFSDPPLDCS